MQIRFSFFVRQGKQIFMKEEDDAKKSIRKKVNVKNESSKI